MVRIKRYAPEELGVDKNLIKKLHEETEKAKLHYAEELNKLKQDANYKIKSFTFNAYRETKKDLIKIYNGKCAYCEASILHGQPGDVEHFRPKSAIKTKIDHVLSLSDKVIPPKEEEHEIKPGYYWLASDWYNLLLSCNLCNRSNTLKNVSKPIDGADAFVEETLGKSSFFPYVDVTKRISDFKKPISQEKEIRLLIDPGEDNPEEHLTFTKYEHPTTTETGEIEIEEKFGMISPLTDKGVASIQIYGLARLQLVLAREQAALQLMGSLTDLKQAVSQFVGATKALQNNPGDEFLINTIKLNDETISNKMNLLKAQFKNNSTDKAPSPFLSMKKVLVRNWIKEENQIVKELVNRGIDIERLLIMDIIKELNFLKSLSIEFKMAKNSRNVELQNAKEKVISKVWNSIVEEVKDGAPHLTSKKSLIRAWVSQKKSREPDVITTLQSLNKDPDSLIN